MNSYDVGLRTDDGAALVRADARAIAKQHRRTRSRTMSRRFVDGHGQRTRLPVRAGEHDMERVVAADRRLHENVVPRVHTVDPCSSSQDGPDAINIEQLKRPM
jgi:hypothetical protein